ncbi:MAG: ABC transporter permease subunit [Thermoplasmata archaeon]
MAEGVFSRQPMPPPLSDSVSPGPGPDSGAHTRARLEESLQAVRETPSLLAGIAFLAFLAGVSVAAVVEFGPHLTSYYVNRLLQRVSDTPPSAAHPFGVINYIGVDVFQGLVQATPLDLILFGSILLGAAGLGLLAGTSGGLFGGRSEWFVSAAADIVGSVPAVFFVSILFVGIGGYVPYQDLFPLFVILFVLVLWPYYARPVLARARQVANTGYVQAAQVAGARRARLLFRHGMPNSYLPILAQLPTDFVNIIFVLTMFPYLSCLTSGGTLLVSPLPNQNYPDWGFLLAYGMCTGWSPFPGGNFWWMYAFPTAAIVFLGTAITLCCDGLERWSSRRLRR